ncbi:nitroreductase family deazaflavin-dependent oxidoreductase [Cellulomonas composti]|uniref:Peptidase n=1 Tax=Cellulomonas composti TaxID=266130 RepID=A0A511JDT3_9CELL|nr:nitroreductase family deazaflavin-dependent oxidoreductase [Cellulomonas composti]GEL95893.1 hypothetical protein CCO02nite_25510 [Cellulomonas composti]
MVLPRWLARSNPHVANRVLGLFADDVAPLAALHHVGRRTGRRYRIPVLAFESPRGIVIALTYGPDVQWLRNVEAGESRLVRRGKVYVLGAPVRVHGADGARLVPAWTRLALRVVRVDDFVVLPVRTRLDTRRARTPRG